MFEYYLLFLKEKSTNRVSLKRCFYAGFANILCTVGFFTVFLVEVLIILYNTVTEDLKCEKVVNALIKNAVDCAHYSRVDPSV